MSHGNSGTSNIVGNYETARIVDADTTERDRAAVLNVCAIADDHGDDDGTVRTELLSALGLHPLAVAMRDGAPLPVRRRPLAARTPVEKVHDDPYEPLPAKAAKTSQPRYRNPKGTIPHGTRNGYTNYSCRCVPCKTAARDYSQQRKASSSGRSS